MEIGIESKPESGARRFAGSGEEGREGEVGEEDGGLGKGVR